MKYIKEKNIIVEDPFKIRPGYMAELVVSAVIKHIETWSNEENFISDYEGMVTVSSIRGNIDIPIDNIDVTYNHQEDRSYVNIIPLAEEGELELTIFSRAVSDTYMLETKSALSLGNESDNLEYYEYVLDKYNLYPMTLIELGDILDKYDRNVNLTLKQTSKNTGICRIIDTIARINSEGMLLGNYVLPKGREEVVVPDSYSGRYIKRFKENGVYKKLVEIYNLEPVTENLEFYGIKEVHDILFILTSDGLYGFDKWSDCEVPYSDRSSIGYVEKWNNTSYSSGDVVSRNGYLYESLIDDNNEPISNEEAWERKAVYFHWEDVNGKDLTYLPDDSLLVANGNVLNKYYLRHDHVMIDKEDNRVYTREKYPDFSIVKHA